MKSDLEEKKIRGTHLFPFQHYKMTTNIGNIFVPYHWHGEIEIICVIKGQLSLLIDGSNYILNPNDIYFINSGQLHQISSISIEISYYAYVFSIDSLFFEGNDFCQSAYLNPLMKDHFFPSFITENNPCYKKVWKEVNELITINEEQPPAYQLITKAALYKIIAYLEQDKLFIPQPHSTEDNTSTLSSHIKELLLYIQSNYTRKIYLSEGAELLHMSPKYFCSYFTSTFGKSFTNYINHFRVEQACLLLITTNMPIMEIAFDVGFENFSYFIRKFKCITGYTPNAYRSTYQM